MISGRSSQALIASAAGLTLGLFAFVGFALAQTSIHRNGFESKPMWTKGGFDAPYQEIAHKIDDREPHNGQGSEFIELDAKQGTHIHYQYPIGKAPINEELRIALW